MSNKALPGTVLVDWKEPKGAMKIKGVEGVLLVAIRIRGNVDKTHRIRKTFELLKLHKKHHAVLLPATPSIKGMLDKVKDFIAYGIIDKETLATMIEKRGFVQGGKKLVDQDIAALSGKASIDELAEALIAMEMEYKDIKKIVPVFRLHPARKGFFNGIKVPRSKGGVLGFWGNDITLLLKRMM